MSELHPENREFVELLSRVLEEHDDGKFDRYAMCRQDLQDLYARILNDHTDRMKAAQEHTDGTLLDLIENLALIRLGIPAVEARLVGMLAGIGGMVILLTILEQDYREHEKNTSKPSKRLARP